MIKTDIEDVDVTNQAQLRQALDRHEPEAVLHLAAAPDVDRCEREPKHAFLNNALRTRNVALECARRNLPLVYVSTAAVFPGDKHEPYHEFDPTGPANVYRHSKLAGEQRPRRASSVTGPAQDCTEDAVPAPDANRS